MADEPERRIVGAILAELEEQAKSINLDVGEVASRFGVVQVNGYVDLVKLAKAILSEVTPPKPPRLIEYDLPVRQTADLVDAPSTIWEVPMKPRNVHGNFSYVQVIASSAEEALSKALSLRPGHSWGKAQNTGQTPFE